MSIRAELFGLTLRALEVLPQLSVTRVFVAHGSPAADRDAEFGLVALDAGTAGLYYAWLGASQAGMRAKFDATALSASTPVDLARLYLGDSDAERSIGLAAISAVTDALFRAASFAPAATGDSLGGFELGPDDHLGMIGNFPPLVRRARASGARVSIVERKTHMVTAEPGLRITLDPAVLGDCTKVICTGATLLNDSLDEMLGYCARSARIVLLGPTVGFFPDPLFARGIAAAGGTRILAPETAYRRLAAGKKLGDSAERTLLAAGEYPGFETLLERASAVRG